MTTYINHCLVVQATLPITELRYLLKEADEAFKDLVQAPLNSTNVNESAPNNIPRFFSQVLDKQLLISNIACQLSFSSEMNGQSLGQQFEIITKNVKDFKRCVDSFYDSSQKQEFGIVIVTSTPREPDQKKVINEMISKLTKLDQFEDPRMFELKYGHSTENQLIKGYVINQYEIKENKTEFDSQGKFIQNLETIEEMGISVTLDVNNKPRFTQDLRTGNDFSEELLSLIKEMLFVDLPKILK